MKNNKRINSNINEDSYLYGFSLKNLAAEPYFYVLIIKYLLAKRLNEHLILNDIDDKPRIDAVFRAKEFNRDLLKEIGYSDSDIRYLAKEYANDLGKLLEPEHESITRCRILFQQSKEYITKQFEKFKQSLEEKNNAKNK